MEKAVFAELSADGRSIEIYFDPSPRWLAIMHEMRARFMPKDKAPEGVAHWRLHLDWPDAQELAARVGKENLTLGDQLNEWAWTQKQIAETVHELVGATSGELSRLPEVLPDLYDAVFLGPIGKNMSDKERKVGLAADEGSYQTADVAFMSFTEHVLNANQPGTGKTIETIASIFEAGTDDGPNLVIAPLTALETVWLEHLQKWQPHPVIMGAGERMPRAKRERAMYEMQVMLDSGHPFFYVCNPDMVRMRKEKSGEEDGNVVHLYSEWPLLHDIKWNNIIIDEVHRGALRNPKSYTAQGMYKLQSAEGGKRFALSGTPLGGRPINLWGILHWLHPDKFSSKWRWAQQWLDLSDNGYGTDIGGIKEARVDDFYKELEPYMVRRTKKEVLTWLPEKDHIDVWCDMTPKQEKQYKEFALAAEVKIGDMQLTATSILAEYTRLKQFAGAVQDLEVKDDGSKKLHAQPDSGKLNQVLEHLEELGILEDGKAVEETKAQTVIFSQFVEIVQMFAKDLVDRGVRVMTLTGETKDRMHVQKSFQAGEVTVAICQTITGGQSIDLDMADTCFILDETWNPDDQEQAEDRIHRGSRIHQVTCYYLRTKGTVDEYIKKTTDRKGGINKMVLDDWRNLRLV